MDRASGRCLCGAVTFEATGVHTGHTACHCSQCRRWTTGPLFTTQVESVEFDGDAPARYKSSDWAERGFCSKCGSTLFYFFKPKSAYFMSVGAFDDASPFRLETELFVDFQPPGYAFSNETKRLTEAELLAMLESSGA